ncbi:hypothetical protein BLNAU_2446 [Blattamonas nauphoetae]|uniref:Uncharacterized protein n=1 Tax=Blattamonas nauphoetae TaxID=2049346 RepID=A0ABQ9YFS0_9EUKA|nr:hypothetical protein BLNAU_2446 [Blattamonas nauphoetae]
MPTSTHNVNPQSPILKPERNPPSLSAPKFRKLVFIDKTKQRQRSPSPKQVIPPSTIVVPYQQALKDLPKHTRPLSSNKQKMKAIAAPIPNTARSSSLSPNPLPSRTTSIPHTNRQLEQLHSQHLLKDKATHPDPPPLEYPFNVHRSESDKQQSKKALTTLRKMQSGHVRPDSPLQRNILHTTHPFQPWIPDTNRGVVPYDVVMRQRKTSNDDKILEDSLSDSEGHHHDPKSKTPPRQKRASDEKQKLIGEVVSGFTEFSSIGQRAIDAFSKKNKTILTSPNQKHFFSPKRKERQITLPDPSEQEQKRVWESDQQKTVQKRDDSERGKEKSKTPSLTMAAFLAELTARRIERERSDTSESEQHLATTHAQTAEQPETSQDQQLLPVVAQIEPVTKAVPRNKHFKRGQRPRHDTKNMFEMKITQTHANLPDNQFSQVVSSID